MNTNTERQLKINELRLSQILVAMITQWLFELMVYPAQHFPLIENESV